jgi:AcrR family transcriptional regulator
LTPRTSAIKERHGSPAGSSRWPGAPVLTVHGSTRHDGGVVAPDLAPSPAPVRRPGRPRDEAAERAILSAALEIAGEVGIRRMTIASVAQRAGVGKATIYRRWPTKAGLVLAALAELEDRPPLPDTGSLRGDLAAYQHEFVAKLAGPGGDSVPHLAAEAAADAELRDRLNRWVAHRRSVLREVLVRAVRRGEMRDDLDVELALDLFSGPLVYRAIFAGLPIDDDVAGGLIDLVLDGLRPRP